MNFIFMANTSPNQTCKECGHFYDDHHFCSRGDDCEEYGVCQNCDCVKFISQNPISKEEECLFNGIIGGRKMNVSCEIRIHSGFAEFKEAIAEGIQIQQLFGEYQYIYSSKKGKISLVKLKDIFPDRWYWEILSIGKKEVFKYTERFEKRHHAIKRIRELLQ